MVNSKLLKKSLKKRSLKLKNKRTKKSKISRKNVRNMKGGVMHYAMIPMLDQYLTLEFNVFKINFKKDFKNHTKQNLYEFLDSKKKEFTIDKIQKFFNLADLTVLEKERIDDFISTKYDTLLGGIMAPFEQEKLSKLKRPSKFKKPSPEKFLTFPTNNKRHERNS